MTGPSSAQLRILIVDDNEVAGSDLETLLRREFADLGADIVRVTTFVEGEALLKAQGFDLAVLDVRLGDNPTNPDDENAGRQVYLRVAEAQWLPVIFWTGVTETVEELAQPPLVQVVNKAGIRTVPDLVRAALDSGVPQFARHVAAEVESAVRGFLRDLVASHWADMAPVEKEDVLPLLANRLSYYLRNGLLDDLHAEGATNAYDHPSSARYYLMPPVTKDLTTGDLFNHDGQWWVLVTPQCDMEIRRDGKRKVQFLRLVRAMPIEDTTVGKNFIAADPAKMTSVTAKAANILGDDYRFYYLPAYLKVPHLVVDFEQIRSVPIGDLLPPETADLQDPVPAESSTGAPQPWTRVATIDSPYSEALLYRLSRAVSRVGIEEIPPEAAFAHLTARQTEAAAGSQTAAGNSGGDGRQGCPATQAAAGEAASGSAPGQTDRQTDGHTDTDT